MNLPSSEGGVEPLAVMQPRPQYVDPLAVRASIIMLGDIQEMEHHSYTRFIRKLAAQARGWSTRNEPAKATFLTGH